MFLHTYSFLNDQNKKFFWRQDGIGFFFTYEFLLFQRGVNTRDYRSFQNDVQMPTLTFFSRQAALQTAQTLIIALLLLSNRPQ